ncbi:hypothetical protein [Saccharothrix stipae]
MGSVCAGGRQWPTSAGSGRTAAPFASTVSFASTHAPAGANTFNDLGTSPSGPVSVWMPAMLRAVSVTDSPVGGSTCGRTASGTASCTAAYTTSVTAIAATVRRNRIATAMPSTNANAA